MSNRGLSNFRLVPGQYREIAGINYDTPKELWGFRINGGPGEPQDIARTVLDANAKLLGLEQFPIRQRQIIPSLGGWHVIYDQVRDDGIRIHRAYVSVHMNLRHEVYLVKNRAVPVKVLDENPEDVPRKWTIPRVERKARRLAKGHQKTICRLQREPVWYAVRRRLHLAHMFRFRTGPRPEEIIVYIDRENGDIFSLYDNLAHTNVHARVFDPNPVIALGNWNSLLDHGRPIRKVSVDDAYERVLLRDIASLRVLTGPNVTIVRRRRDGRPAQYDFERLASHKRGFEAVMAYFHVDSAVRYVEALGYIGDKCVWLERTSEGRVVRSRLPLRVKPRATPIDNSGYYAGSFYSPRQRYLGFGTGDVDDAEDGETIIHEFGHALQDAICSDFGQSREAAAIGEGFGDYFAASFFAAKKRKRRKILLPTVMTWDGILMRDPEHKERPPCVRRLDSPKTYKDFNNRMKEHRNGEIWSAALWGIWKAIGRHDADRIIIESHFQLDGFTTFSRAARAIIDADRNLADAGIIERAHTNTLKRIFHRRGIGPVE